MVHAENVEEITEILFYFLQSYFVVTELNVRK